MKRFSLSCGSAVALVLIVIALLTNGKNGAIAATPTTRAETVTKIGQSVTTRGTFKSDRGDFEYLAQYWPDDTGRSDKVGSQILRLADDLEDADTFNRLTDVYSPESLTYLQNRRVTLEKSVGVPSGNPPGVHSLKRISHLITAVSTDRGGTLYFARTEVVTPDIVGSDPWSTHLHVEEFIDAYRGRDGVIKFDTPARESPIYEAIKFGQWYRFGLPTPDVSVGEPTTKSAVPDVATPAQVKEMMALIDQLSPAEQRSLFLERQEVPNLTQREAAIWLTDTARNILAKRPSTEPTKP